jgi:hypothetical protein
MGCPMKELTEADLKEIARLDAEIVHLQRRVHEQEK